MKPLELLEQFDRFLVERGLRFRAVVVGGTALNLLGVINRPTKDCDILYPQLPFEIGAAARAFATDQRARGESLADDWLNNGPAALADTLPRGWQERVQPLFTGAALALNALGRADLLRSKLWALCDRGFDLSDCIALAPTADELELVRPWLEAQDANREWPAHVRATLADVGRRLGHGV